MNIYRTNKIDEHLTLICEYLSVWSLNVFALVEGDEAAALVDTGMGVTGDLDRFVSTLTDKPIRYCLLTHGDPDHVGSAPLFDQIYMSKKDDSDLAWGLSAKTRLDYVDYMSEGNRELTEYSARHQVKQETMVYKNISDGQIFDLGNLRLEAIAFPGHSPGSMCFYNRADNYVLTGDAFNPFVWLWLDRCPSIEEYYEYSKAFLSRIRPDSTLYCGHMMEVLPKEFPGEIMAALEEILAGDTAGDVGFEDQMVLLDLKNQAANGRIHQVGNTCVFYNFKNIYRNTCPHHVSCTFQKY